jgi:AraC-like DNA-binding protein
MTFNKDSRRIFDAYDLTISTIPLPTELYPMEPRGIGTPYVCSLTSYIANLAFAHSVAVSDLFSEVILYNLKSLHDKEDVAYYNLGARTVAHFAPMLNGTNDSTANITHTLEHLTGRNDLRFLTMLPFSQVIPAYELIRENHAWCPLCYEEQLQSGNQVNDYLLWSLRHIRICLKHNCLIEEQCPYEDCKHTFRRLTSHYTPGFCAMCNRWLGKRVWKLDETTHITQSDVEHWGRIRFDAEVIGELISLMPTLVETPTQSNLVDGIKQCIEQFANGKKSTFAKQVTLERAGIYALLKGERIIGLNQLLAIAFHTGISLPELLIHGKVVVKSEPKFDVGKVKSRKNPKRYTPEELKELRVRFEAILQYDSPISFRKAAQELNCDTVTLYYHFPELRKKAVSNYENHKEHQKENELIGIEYGLQEILKDQDGIVLSLAQISKHVNRSIPYLKRNFPELCNCITQRYRESQLNQGEERRKAQAQKIKEAVLFLHERGRYPRANLVAQIAGIGTIAFLEPSTHAAWKNTLQDLGYSVH